MTKINLPENSIGFVFSINSDTGEISLSSAVELGDELLPEQAAEMINLFNGMSFFLDYNVEYLASSGAVIRELDEEHSTEIRFEPDEELVDSVSGAKIIPINGKKRPV